MERKTTPSVDQAPSAAADDLKHPNRSPAERVRFGKGRRSQHSAVFAARRKRNGVGSLMETKSKPNEMGSIWKGKTTPSVDRTPPAAADDLKHPNRSPAERVRFGKGRRSQHSAVFAARRKRNGVGSLMETKSKPNEMGSIWKGKTTPSVNRTPPAAADDLMVLF